MAQYKYSYKLHLPTDLPWRDKPEDVRNEVTTKDPLALWRSIIMEATDRLQMSHDIGFFVGLMLNLINPFPDEVRVAIANGIAGGSGLSFKVIGDEIVVSLDTKFSALPVLGPSGKPERRTASGLILP